MAPSEDGTISGWSVTDPALADLLVAWSASPGHSRLLITSRYPIAVPPTLRARLHEQVVEPLSAAEAGKLIWSLSHVDRQINSGVELEHVWRMVGGHPRTLEYLEALLGQGVGRFDDITHRLVQAVRSRLGPVRDAVWLAEHRTLDTAVADAITLVADDILLAEHLDRLATIPNAIRVLVAVSVYREPAPALALAFHLDPPERPATGNQPPSPPHDLGQLLTRLSDTGLIHYSPDRDTVFMHRWTATELQRHWREAATVGTVITAHQVAAAFWQWHVRAGAQDRATIVHAYEEARHHLVAAGDLDQANTVTEYLCSELDAWGAWDRESSLIHDTLTWLPLSSPRRVAWHNQLGNLAYRRGDHWEAQRLYRQSLAEEERLGDDAGVAATYHQLGVLAQARGEYDDAERLYHRSLTIHEGLGDQAGLASGYHQLGILDQARGRYDDAKRRYDQALAIRRTLGDEAGLASGYHQLGVLDQALGKYDDAKRRYDQALAIRTALGHQPSLASSYHQLGLLAQALGDYSEAERRYQQSLAIDEQLGHESGLASGHHQLGIVAQARGDNEEAARRYGLSLTIGERLGDQAGQASAHYHLGRLAQVRGDYGEAERRYRISLAINHRLGNQAGIATGLSQLGNLSIALGQPANAVLSHVVALAIRLRIGVPEVRNNFSQLSGLRTVLGPDAFRHAARGLGDESFANLTTVLDRLTDDQRDI